MVIATLIAFVVLIVAALAEAMHARRTARIGRLAFGPKGRPAAWTVIAPPVRCVGLALAVWGALVLAQWDPVETDPVPAAKASRQLLICLDVSPSMQLQDAGPDAEKISRARWAGKITQGILDRLDMKETRITVVAFYSKALTVLRDTTDRNVVRNMLDGLPMYVAFEPGGTDLGAGLREAVAIAKPWARKSATLVVISDGDVEHGAAAVGSVSLPASIADTIVIGVGDPGRASLVGGHASRQDTWSLKQVAARLGGIYHEGNRLHLPSSVLDRLSMITPTVGSVIGLREAALIALGLGCAMTALIGPALMWLGVPRAFAKASARAPLERSLEGTG